MSHRVIEGKEKFFSAFLFNSNSVVGDPTAKEKTKDNFKMMSTAQTLNWELVIETFALLPLEKGRVFKLNFYHPGSQILPSAYDYVVTGEENPQGPI